MPAYKINIDGRVYTGCYARKSAAVFGAMLKDENDRYDELGYVAWCEEPKTPSLIGIESIPAAPKKIRRVA